MLRVAPGSSAATVGLQGAQTTRDGRVQPGDIITAIDGKPVESVSRYLSRLDDFDVGETVTLTVSRGQGQISVQATLEPES